jgi:transposase
MQFCEIYRSWVKSACRYELEVPRTYEELAKHYGTVILPARPAKPRDKAKVKAGVLVAERRSAGQHAVPWRGEDLAPRVYFLRQRRAPRTWSER